jgi:hydrogenase-4 component B
MPIAVGLLALTSGLAAACFVKAFGITFLAIPRSREAEEAQEAPVSMQIGMAALGLACVGLGLLPFVVVPVLCAALAGLGGLPDTPPSFTAGLALAMPGGFAQMSPALVALGLVLTAAVVWLAVRLAASTRPVRVGETWGCGRVGHTARMEYTATAFAEPLRRVFAELYRPTEDLSIDFHPESRYFVQSIRYRSEIVPWFERYLYAPLVERVRRLAVRVRLIQSGSVHAYLTYVVIALVAMLGMLLL